MMQVFKRPITMVRPKLLLTQKKLLTMSSRAVVLVGMFVLVLLLWIERRKKFSGPKLDWDALRTSGS